MLYEHRENKYGANEAVGPWMHIVFPKTIRASVSELPKFLWNVRNVQTDYILDWKLRGPERVSHSANEWTQSHTSRCFLWSGALL